jgi:membrane protein DedA with SNARE-associated domain
MTPLAFSIETAAPASQHWLAKALGGIFAVISSFGGLGVMLIAIGDSSFLSMPEGNDLLIVVLSTGKSWGNMAYYVSMTTIGSVIGCMLLYLVGRKGGSPLMRRRFAAHKIARAEKLVEKYGIWSVMIPSILPPPLPFKIFVLSAGVFRMNALAFVSAVVIGRTARYSMWGVLAVLYGNTVKHYMQDNLEEVGIVLCIGFVLVLGLLAAYWLYRGRGSRKGNGGLISP